jgi:hypothetical protein
MLSSSERAAPAHVTDLFGNDFMVCSPYAWGMILRQQSPTKKVGAGGTAKWTSKGANDEWRETTAPFVRPCIVENGFSTVSTFKITGLHGFSRWSS